jgi:phosphoribosyl 1,2-cyclic phosphodiesterase
MIAFSLQSGSNGNCVYVESCGVGLLLDAGISGIQAERRLFVHRREIRTVRALLISHDHADHVRCAGVLHRKYKLPVFATEKTRAAADGALDGLAALSRFRAGEVLRFGPLSVETVPTPHDAADGVGFVVTDGRARVGLLTDLGHVFNGLADVVRSLDGVFIESNYDPDMLRTGPYPEFLKARIRGPRGHISNAESAELLRLCAGPRLKWVCLAHLSEHNNRPDLALRTHREISPASYRLAVASRYEVSGIFEL